MSTPYKLLAISGSLRKASYTTALLKALADKAPLDITLADITEVPVYNQDLDIEPNPASVETLRAQVKAADGIIIGSPEYNYSMPGSIKNVLDWLSRPYGKAALEHKPVLIITCSPGSTGGVRAQGPIRASLAAIGAYPLGGAEVVISGVDKKFSDGVFTDEANMSFMLSAVDRLIKEIDVRTK